MNPKVSVIVCTYNDEAFLPRCIGSILAQSFRDFEFIIFNDGSTDNTRDVVCSFTDERIRYIEMAKNTGMLGIIRSQAIKQAKGEYVFLTDSDCAPRSDWLQRGIEAIEKYKSDAIEGKIIYHEDGYRKTLSDRVNYNLTGGMWMTGNMAYRRAIFDRMNFDPNFHRLEDREFALRIQKESPIPFIPDMVIYQQQEKRGIRRFLQEAEINMDLRPKIELIRKYNDQNDLKTSKYRIYAPMFLAVIFFPPLILAEVFLGRIRSWDDLKLLPFVWIKAIYMRYLIWKTAIEERYFIL